MNDNHHCSPKDKKKTRDDFRNIEDSKITADNF
jgi:hypothetical protein